MTPVRFTFIRHGDSQTPSNSLVRCKSIRGHNTNARLNQLGEKQAKQLGSFLKTAGIVFTSAYSSTASRTYETARLCFNAMGCTLPLIQDQRLLERDVGDWEGLPRSDIYKRADVREARAKDIWDHVPGDITRGESHRMVAERMYAWLKEKIEYYSAKNSEQHIVVFSHSVAIKCLLAETFNLDRSMAWRDDVNPIEKTSVTEILFRGLEPIPELVKRNNLDHLADRVRTPSAVPLFVNTGDGKQQVDKKNPIIKQLDSSRVALDYVNGEIIITPAKEMGFVLHHATPFRVDLLLEQVQLAAFALCLNKKGEMLLIRKGKSDFWYIPGGLVRRSDQTIWEVACRETEEESGITLSEKGEAFCLYESFVPHKEPTKHNLHAIYLTHYDGDEWLPVFADCRWCHPVEYLATHKNAHSSSIGFALMNLAHMQLREALAAEYEEYHYQKQKDAMLHSPLNSLMFDFCFLRKLKSSPTAFSMIELMEAVTSEVQLSLV